MSVEYRDLFIYKKGRGLYSVCVWSGDDKTVYGKIFSQVVKSKKKARKLEKYLYVKYELARFKRPKK